MLIWGGFILGLELRFTFVFSLSMFFVLFMTFFICSMNVFRSVCRMKSCFICNGICSFVGRDLL